MSETESCDLLIVGAGPAGCTAAMYAARAGIETIMISPSELSGMMSEAPAMENFPGQVEPAAGRQILKRIRRQALKAGAEHRLEPAATVDVTDDGRLTVYAGPDVHEPQGVIVATSAMGRTGQIPGENDLLGRGVARCVACDGPLFEGERVIVLGEDTKAIEETLALAQIAEEVIFITPEADLDFAGAFREEINNCENVTVRCGLNIEQITGEQEVTGAVFTDADGAELEISAAGIFLYLRGTEPMTDFLDAAVELDDDGFIVTDENCRTSLSGAFAAGDVRSKDVRQAVVAASEGAVAALQCARYLRDGASVTSDRGPKAE